MLCYLDEAESLNLDKDDDIQFVAEYLDDELDRNIELELELLQEQQRYAPKVKRPRRAIDFDEDLFLDLEDINREQQQVGVATETKSRSRTAPEEPEIVVRHRQVLKLIPTVPYMPIACEDGSRVYLRVALDPDKIVVNSNPNILEQISMMNRREEAPVQIRRGLLGVSVDELRRRYNEEVLLNSFLFVMYYILSYSNACVQQKNFDAIMGDLILADAGAGNKVEILQHTNSRGNSKRNEDMLWVEKYKPKSYMDLLSEESINHTLLHWLKLWDNAVFGTDYLNKVKQTKEKYAALGKLT